MSHPISATMRGECGPDVQRPSVNASANDKDLGELQPDDQPDYGAHSPDVEGASGEEQCRDAADEDTDHRNHGETADQESEDERRREVDCPEHEPGGKRDDDDLPEGDK
jgi:hypothetical protein